MGIIWVSVFALGQYSNEPITVWKICLFLRGKCMYGCLYGCMGVCMGECMSDWVFVWVNNGCFYG